MNLPWAHWGNALLGLFFPRTCVVCRTDLPSASDPLCAPCLGSFPVWAGLSCRVCGIPLPDGGARCFDCRRRRRSFRFSQSAGLYEGALRSCLVQLKYGKKEALARPLGLWMAEKWGFRPELKRVDALVPVPLHFIRGRTRGYNQATLLARPFGEKVGIPVWEEVLTRRRWGRSQTRLRREARRKNVEGAFFVPRPDRVGGKRLLLVDDVCTTGATLDACARALREAGAAWVGAFTAARRGTGRFRIGRAGLSTPLEKNPSR